MCRLLARVVLVAGAAAGVVWGDISEEALASATKEMQAMVEGLHHSLQQVEAEKATVTAACERQVDALTGVADGAVAESRSVKETLLSCLEEKEAAQGRAGESAKQAADTRTALEAARSGLIDEKARVAEAMRRAEEMVERLDARDKQVEATDDKLAQCLSALENAGSASSSKAAAGGGGPDSAVRAELEATIGTLQHQLSVAREDLQAAQAATQETATATSVMGAMVERMEAAESAASTLNEEVEALRKELSTERAKVAIIVDQLHDAQKAAKADGPDAHTEL